MRFASDAWLAFLLLLLSALALAAFVVVGFGPLPSRALRSSTSEPAPPPPVAGTEFVDVTDAIGLSECKHDIPRGVASIADAVAPGLGLLDLDQDGDLDLVLLGGPGARTGVSILLNRLIERERLVFEDVTEAAGIVWRGAAQGVCAGDVDADGDVDLFVTALGPNLLLLNQISDDGVLRFVDDSEATGLTGGLWHWEASRDLDRGPVTRPGPPTRELGEDWEFHGVPEFSTGASFGDLDGDGDLDLFVANYVSYYEERHRRLIDPKDRPERPEPFRFQPTTFEPQPDTLYLNDGEEGDLFLRDVTRAAKLNDRLGRGMGAVFMLVDGDIYPDVYVANDASDNVYFHNVAVTADEKLDFKRRLKDETVEYGLNDSHSGMGIARGDADCDADLDLLTTNFRYSASLFLFRSESKASEDGTTRVEPIFDERGEKAGLGKATLPFVAWGCVFFDYDDDGDEDLFVGNGFTSPSEGALSCTPEKPLLFRNDGAGHFVDVTRSAGPALAIAYSARGVVAGDLDRDGDLDLVIAQNNGPVIALENRPPPHGNHALTVEVGFGTLRGDAVNAKVVALVGGRQHVRELVSGGSYLSQGPFEAHFGLGRLPRADRVVVMWPWLSGRLPLIREPVEAGRHRFVWTPRGER